MLILSEALASFWAFFALPDQKKGGKKHPIITILPLKLLCKRTGQKIWPPLPQAKLTETLALSSLRRLKKRRKAAMLEAWKRQRRERPRNSDAPTGASDIINDTLLRVSYQGEMRKKGQIKRVTFFLIRSRIYGQYVGFFLFFTP